MARVIAISFLVVLAAFSFVLTWRDLRRRPESRRPERRRRGPAMYAPLVPRPGEGERPDAKFPLEEEVLAGFDRREVSRHH
jgi:hypothetical protein